MALYRKKLQNGMYYNHITTDRFKTAYLSVNFILPLEKDSAAYYALLPCVLQRGCKKYPEYKNLVRRFDELYGTSITVGNTKRGEAEVVSFSINMLDNAYLPEGEDLDLLREATRLLLDVITDPITENDLFLEKNVESERRNCMDARRAAINNKQRYAYERCVSLMFAGERYGVPADGEIEDYENIDPAKLVCLYNDMLQSACAEIFYVGKDSPEKVEALLLENPVFSNRIDGDVTFPKTVRDFDVKEVRHFEETTPAEQGKLVIGYRVATQDTCALSLFNEIYGGSPSSKLFMNVREKLSLCYYCSSQGDAMKGVLFVFAGIENENVETALAEIKKQLDNIRQSEITDEELLCAKQSLANAYRSLSDSAKAMETWYLRRIMEGNLEEPEEVLKKIAALDAEDVVRVAKSIVCDTVYFLKGDKSSVYNKADREDEE